MKVRITPVSIFLVLLLLLSSNMISQNEGVNFVLNNSQTGTTHSYVAKDYIRLKPGFHYQAGQSTNFNAKINPLLVFPPAENTYLDANGNIVESSSQGAVVGNLSGTFDVSPTGAATYSVPIEVLPGIQGMQPNISLVYNSQSGAGIAGMCWSLGGLSMISRVPKDYYYDDERSGIIWDEIRGDGASPLALDGQRLIEIDRLGNLWVEYRTEAGVDIIKGYDWWQAGHYYFEVFTKDGRTLTYGSIDYDREHSLSYCYPIRSTFDVLSNKISQSDNLGWLLYEIRDNNDNYVKYFYTNTKWNTDNNIEYYGDNRISRIEYGNGDSKVASVHFSYKDKSSSFVQYINDIETKNQLILDKIEIKGLNDELHETYQLTYKVQDQNEFLTQIKRSNSSGEVIHPLKFDWYPMGYDCGNLSSISFELPDNVSSRDDLEYFTSINYGDIDGDGLTDFLVHYSSKNATGSYWAIYQNNGSNYAEFKYKDIWNEDRYTFLFLDLDNDGMDELYKGLCVRDEDGKYKHHLSCYKLINGSFQSYTGGNLSPQEISKSVYDNEKSLYPLSGDYMGNGSQQIIYFQKNTDTHKPVAYFGLGTATLPIAASVGSQVLLTDINGNGKTEIVYINQNTGSTSFYEYQGGAFVSIFTTSLFKYKDRIQVGDFNGDGHTDLLVKKYSDNNWRIWFSFGSDFTEEMEIASHLSNYDDALVIDANKDGKSDILVDAPIFVDNASNSSNIKILINNGESFTSQILEEDVASFSFVTASNLKSIHNPDIYIESEGKRKIMPFSPNIWFNKIKTITDSYGQKLTIIHKTNSKSPYSILNNFINSDDGTNSIKTHLPQLEVVDAITATAVNQSYTFKDAYIHRESRGFIGFLNTTITDSIYSVKTEVENKLDSTYHFLYPYKTTVKRTNGTLINKSSQTYTVSNTEGKRYFLQLNEEISTDTLKGITVKTTYSNYDTERNPLTITTDYGDNNNITSTQTLTYVKPPALFFSKVASRQVTQKATGQDNILREEHFFYDDIGNITQHTKDSTDVNKVRTVYSDYDTYGNPGKITTAANDISRSKGMTYCSYGRFLKTETDNQFNETVTYNYNESRGLLASRVDRIGTTSYQYDGFGRLTLTTYPDGVKTTNALQWAGTITGKPENALYYSYTETSGQSPVWVWHDYLGREIRRDAYGLSQKKIYTDTEYDAKGRVFRVSEPYFDNTTPTWAITYEEYDNYGRILETISPMGTTTYEYNGLKTTVTTPVGKKETTINPAGWVVKEESYEKSSSGKSVDFIHYASGLVKTATPQDGQPITIEYDLQGNRTKLTDPDAGVINSKYDGWGQLLWEKQAVHKNGSIITTSYHYYPSGLLEYKLCGDEETGYGYDDKFRLKRISIEGKHGQGFVYDQYDRIVQSSDTVDAAKVFVRKMEYNRFGDIYKETYPSGYYVTNRYDANGFLTKVTDRDGRAIWEAVEGNARGQLTKTKRGGKQTEYDYTPKGEMERIYASGIMDEQYLYYATGNLERRTNGLNTQYDQFEYDTYNRLKVYNVYQLQPTVALLRNSSVNYNDQTGNIENKGFLGDFNYGENGKPHALTSITKDDGSVSPAIPTDSLSVTYTDFKKIATLSEGDKQYALSYGVDEQRTKSVFTTTNGSLTRYYMGDYEEEVDAVGNIRKLHYIGGGDGWAAAYIQNYGRDTMLYVYTDRLGSLTALTDESHAVVERYAFDPWGLRRNPSNWGEYDSRTAWLLNRGFTGHEHLDAFGIINMNGRVYDPLTGMFFSPDPYVQAPGNWLNYNRYSYALNNPLMYTDPSGEAFFTILAAIFCPPLIPAAFSLDVSWMQGGFNARSNGGSFWAGAGKGLGSGLANLGLSYVSGGLTSGVGNLFGHGLGSVGTELVRAGAHSAISGGISVAQGGKFWQGAAVGFASSLGGSGMSALGMPNGALPIAMGGIGALTSWGVGVDPMSGFMQGYGIGALNHNGGSGTMDDPVRLDEITVRPVPWMRLPQSGALNNVYPEFLALGLGKLWYNVATRVAAKGGGQTVYRAVNAAERASINKSGNFLLKEGGTEVKYFAKSLEDAYWYGSRLYPEGYSVIRGTINPATNIGTYWYPTVDIGAYAFPGNFLPYIKPIFP